MIQVEAAAATKREEEEVPKDLKVVAVVVVVKSLLKRGLNRSTLGIYWYFLPPSPLNTYYLLLDLSLLYNTSTDFMSKTVREARRKRKSH